MGLLPGLSNTLSLAVSADGFAVVGYGLSSGTDLRATLWTPAVGLVDLNIYLAGLGINLAGWTLTSATGMNATGTVIVGNGLHNGLREGWIAALPPAVLCSTNCDGSTSSPVLNINDFICFMNKFASGDAYANCDGSTVPPVLNVNDFTCFLNRLAAGCP